MVDDALCSSCLVDELAVIAVVVVLKNDCGVAALVMVGVCRPILLPMRVTPECPGFSSPSELVLPGSGACGRVSNGGDLNVDLLSGELVRGLAQLSAPWGITAIWDPCVIKVTNGIVSYSFVVSVVLPGTIIVLWIVIVEYI